MKFPASRMLEFAILRICSVRHNSFRTSTTFITNWI